MRLSRAGGGTLPPRCEFPPDDGPCGAWPFGLTLSMARGGCERRAYMVTRISKTGAIYYDYPPFDKAELEEEHPSEVKEGAAGKVIALERVEAGRHAFIAVGERGQLVGWC